MARALPFYSVFLAILRSPRTAIADVAARGAQREGLSAILVLGVLHAGFSLLLYWGGHAPRRGIPGFAREPHYLWQAIFIIPLYLLLFGLGALVTHGLARKFSGSGSRQASLAVFGVAYAIPMIVFFIVPDIIVFLTLGFSFMGKAMRFYAPIAALTCLWLGAWGIFRAHKLGPGRATFVVFIGFFVQSLVGSVFLR